MRHNQRRHRGSFTTSPRLAPTMLLTGLLARRAAIIALTSQTARPQATLPPAPAATACPRRTRSRRTSRTASTTRRIQRPARTAIRAVTLAGAASVQVRGLPWPCHRHSRRADAHGSQLRLDHWLPRLFVHNPNSDPDRNRCRDKVTLKVAPTTVGPRRPSRPPAWPARDRSGGQEDSSPGKLQEGRQVGQGRVEERHRDLHRRYSWKSSRTRRARTTSSRLSRSPRHKASESKAIAFKVKWTAPGRAGRRVKRRRGQRSRGPPALGLFRERREREAR